MKLFKELKDKVSTLSAKVMTGAALVPAYVTVGVNKAYAGMDDWFKTDGTTVSSKPDAGKLMGGILSLIGSAALVVGIFMIVGGAIAYFQAKANDNSAGESKAAWAMGVGFLFMMVKTVLIPLFTG